MMLFLIFKEPYKIKEVGQDGNLIPDVELFNAKNYQIKQSGIESIVISQRVARYKDFDKLYVVDVQHRNQNGLIDNIQSNEAILKDSVIDFMENSHYQRDDGVALDGTEIRYNIKEKILSSDKPFIFSQKQSKTVGNSFVYQMKEGTINANNIHSVIQVGK